MNMKMKDLSTSRNVDILIVQTISASYNRSRFFKASIVIEKILSSLNSIRRTRNNADLFKLMRANQRIGATKPKAKKGATRNYV